MIEKKHKSEIEYVLSCVKKIDARYYRINGNNFNRDRYRQAGENTFTAELFHWLRTDQEKLGFDNLIWHFDLNKSRLDGKRPDLVLHSSPKHDCDQRIFIEIKTSPGNHRSDLEKLEYAVSKDDGSKGMTLGFEFGIYIVGNNNNIKSEIKDYGYKPEIAEKLYLIDFNAFAFKPEVTSFVDVI